MTPLRTLHRPPTHEEQEQLSTLFARLTARPKPAAGDVAQLSDLPRRLVPLARSHWQTLPVETRQYVVGLMAELAESTVELNFRRIFEIALEDPDPTVRAKAVGGLWEEDDPAVLDQLLALLDRETSQDVREALALALGRFSAQAALQELDESRIERLHAALHSLASDDEPVVVRRRAIEALAYFSDRDPTVHDLIAAAYDAPEHLLRVSALFAMGRTLDRRWLPVLLAELTSDDPELRYEAARACGELGAPEAVDELLALVNDPDREVQGAAIDALGRIGGTIAINTLRRLARSSDPVVRDAAEEALEQALFLVDPLQQPGP